MPQVFQVLRCYKCLVFQVHQTKKSYKFQCKICGERQAIKRHYGLGNGQECRLHVQKLNGIRDSIDNISEKSDFECEEEVENACKDSKQYYLPITKHIRHSKWSAFIEQNQIEQNNDHTNETIYLDEAEVLEKPTNCRKLANNNSYKNKRNICISTKSQGDRRAESSTYLESQFENAIDTCKDKKTFKILRENPGIHHKEEEEDDIKENSRHNNKKAINFIPPIVNNNSKWAQYCDESFSYCDEACNSSVQDNVANNHNIESQKELLKTHETVPGILFSLCQEDELDSVLKL